VRVLVETEFAGTPFAEIGQSAIAAALREDDELRGIVAERDGEIVGVAVYGRVAGALGAAKLYLLAVTAAARLRGVGRCLCDTAVDELARDGARLVVAELPEIPGLLAGRELLGRCGWEVEGRVDDFFADGVPLLLMRRGILPE